MTATREDLLIAEHVLLQKFATREQVDECLALAVRMRGEMKLEMTLGDVLAKRGYINPAQLTAVQQAFDPAAAAKRKNVIPGYQLLERVGVGAMGSVYRARDLQLDIPVAIKILRLALASSPTQIERLKREARFVAKLSHPNIVSSRAVGESSGLHYLVMDYVDGATVRQALRDGPLAEKTALRITRDVARALQHAHEAGIIHRDVKPGNVMQAHDGTIKLADFGLARGEAPSDLTLEHASIGTPHYVAPEQMRRAADATARSDLFGLGATLYHMVTGRPPFQGQTLGEIIQNVMACRFDPPESLRADLSIDTIYLIHRLMRADPAERYPDAASVLADLAKLERGQSIAPSTFRGEYREHLSARRRRTMWITAAILAVIAVPVAWWVGHRQAEQDREEHAKYCRALTRTGENKLPQAGSVAELRRIQTDMKKAWGEANGADCNTLDLRARMQHLQEDLRRLKTAEECVREVATGDPRLLKPTIDGLQCTYEPVRREVLKAQRKFQDIVANRLAKLDESFRNRGTPASRNVADKWLEGYVSEAEKLLASSQHRSYRLRDAFAQMQQYVDRNQLVLSDPDRKSDYRSWWSEYRTHVRLVEERLKGSVLPETFHAVFLPSAAVEIPITERERKEWNSVRASVRTKLRANDVRGARALITPFVNRAEKTRKAAEALESEVKAQSKDKSEGQRATLEIYQRGLLKALQSRNYAKAAEEGRRARTAAEWTSQMAKEVAVFAAHAEQYGILGELLKKRGVAEAGKAAHAYLVQVLQPNDGIEEAVAHFQFGESFAAADPRAGRRALEQARDYFEREGRWALVDARVREHDEWLATREKDARRYLEERAAAYSRKDYLSEARLCERLLKTNKHSLRWTDAVDAAHAMLMERAADLVTLAGDDVTREIFGVPPDHVHTAADSGVTTVRFDFRNWYPRERAIPRDVADEKAWLEEQRRLHWFKIFDKNGVAASKREAHLARASRQLREFSSNLVGRQGGDGATLLRSRFDAQFAETGSVPVVTLQHRFDTTKDHSIECTLIWNEEREQLGRPNDLGEFVKEPIEPTLFAIGGAGAFAVFVHDRDSTGARVFSGKSPFDGLERLFRDRDKWSRRPTRKVPDRMSGFSLDARTPYRFRVEFKPKERTVHVHAAPFENWKRARRSLKWTAKSAEEWSKVVGSKFQFASLVRFTLREVVIEGQRASR